jgi:hypothetical protein
MQIRGKLLALVIAAVAATAVILALGTAHAAGAATGPDQATYQVLSNSQKSALDVKLMTNFVTFAEKFWRASDIPQPDTGNFLGTGSGVAQPRGDGDTDYVLATLLKAEPNQQSFGGVSRATLLSQLIQSIRYTAYTNVYSGAGLDRWGAASGPASDGEFSLETYSWAGAAYLIWDQLDAQTQALVKKVLVGEANLVASLPPVDAVPGNTGAETDAWDVATPALAADMFPHDPDAAAWKATAIEYALNSSSIPGDKTSSQVVDGKPLSSWITTTNMSSDLTLENHGYFNMDYQMVTHLLINDAAIMDAQAGQELPQAVSFRTQQIWDQLIEPLTADNGDLLSPAGQDWASKDFQWVAYLGEMATRFGSPVASVLESRALQQVGERQAANGNDSITGMTQLGYEAMLARRISADWWDHKLFSPSPSPSQETFDSDYQASAGVHTWPDAEVIGGRFGDATATMSWDSNSPMGTWAPRTHDDMTDAAVTEDAPSSLFHLARGTASGPYTCSCGSNQFATAGTVGSKQLAMATFSDGTTLLLDKGTGATFTYSFDQIPGLTGPRPVYSAGGTGLGTLSGNWVDVANKMAMITAGGSGIKAADAAAGSNFSTNDTPLILTGSTGTGSGNRGAELLPNISPSAAATLSSDITQPTAPTGWGALQAQAPDGTDRVVIARWSGADTGQFALTDPRGAPVTTQTATANAGISSFEVTPVVGATGAPAATQETIHYFVNGNGPVQASQSAAGGATLSDASTNAVNGTVTYVGAIGTQTTKFSLKGGETAQARLIGDELVAQTPPAGGVSLLVVPEGALQQGEPAQFTVYALNQGATASTDGRVSVRLPGGTAGASVAIYSSLAPGATAVATVIATVPASATPWSQLTPHTELTADGQHASSTSGTSAVTPLFIVSRNAPDIELAVGGHSQEIYTLTNFNSAPLTVSLAGQGPTGVTASFSNSSITIPANGTAQVTASVDDTSESSGTGALTLTATAANGVVTTASSTLHFTTDLALNTYGAAFPAAFASSSQSAYPPSLAIDGSTSDFWVSGGPATTDSGPTPANPVALGVNFGAPVSIASVTMTPRADYGPTDYTVQVSSDDQNWTTVGTVTGADATAATTTTFTPVTAQWLRLEITGSHDGTDRNVQVAELDVQGAG